MSATRLSLDCFRLDEPVGEFFTCVIPAQTLLGICRFDFRRIESNAGVKEFLGIQRKLDQKRVRDIRKYIATDDASFPTSVVINVDLRCASTEGFENETKSGRLILQSFQNPDDQGDVVPFTAIATIIDGQHRLAAFDGSPVNWDLSVNILVGADPGTQAMIFSKVNLAQTKVNKSLVYDLFSLDSGRSPEKTAHEIAVNLNDMPESPFKDRIKRLGTATDGVFGETLSQATVVRGLLRHISKDPMQDRDIGRRTGIFPARGSEDFEKRIFYPFFQSGRDAEILKTLLNYFGAVAERWPLAWSFTGKGAVLPKTNGFDGLIRFLRDAYLFVTTDPRVVTKGEFLSILERVELSDNEITVERFKPGSSGASELYKVLKFAVEA